MNKRATAYGILLGEAIITIVMAVLFWVFDGGIAAYSALLGGLAYILPNSVFVNYAFKHSAAESAHLVLNSLLMGEGLKLLSTAVCFALCFALVKPVAVIALFSTFVTMVFLNLAGIAIIMK